MDKYIFKKRQSLSNNDCKHVIHLLDKSEVIKNPRGYDYVNGSFRSIEYNFLKSILLNGVSEYIKKHPYLEFKYNPYVKMMIDNHFMIKKFLPGEFYGCTGTSEPSEAEHMEEGPLGSEGEKRILAWMIYLNDIKNKGGTCFPQQNFTAKPRAGDLYIWPAGWTHSHYGIPAPKEKKYFISGWFYLVKC